MSKQITLRIEVAVLIVVLFLLFFFVEFPYSASSMLCTKQQIQPPQFQQQNQNLCPPSHPSQQPSPPPSSPPLPPAVVSPPCHCPPSPPPSSPVTLQKDQQQQQQQQQQSAPKQRSTTSSSSSSSSIQATLSAEREASHLLRGGSSLDGGALQAHLATLSRFMKDDAARQALADAARAAAREGHREYARFSRALRGVAASARLNHVVSTFSSSSSSSSSASASNYEMFRYQTNSEDDRLSVPTIPRDLDSLEIVTPTNFGLVAEFSSQPTHQQQNSESQEQKQPLRVATLLTGHMRSYRHCAERMRRTVLAPTGSRLFLATYQDHGEKRYGVRDQVAGDESVSWREVVKSYAPFLTGLFVGEVPLMRRRLELAFPVAFSNSQFSWMLFQFLLIEIGVNMTRAFEAGGGTNEWDFSSRTVGEMSFFFPPSSSSSSNSNINNNTIITEDGNWYWSSFFPPPSRKQTRRQQKKQTQEGGDENTSNNNNNNFDVFIRLRPDLFIVGTIRLQSFLIDNSTLTFSLELTCGGEPYTARNYPPQITHAAFDDSVLLVTPHHPRYEWVLDKISDLSLISTYRTATRYLSLFSHLAQMSQSEQDATFVPLCTAERLWKQRSQQHRLQMNRTLGYFAMLRNASTFTMGRFEGANTEWRRRLVRTIFSISNSAVVPCPWANGTMLTGRPLKKEKDKRGKKGR